jgi:hypothetical protein
VGQPRIENCSRRTTHTGDKIMPSELMTDTELRQWLRHIEYQNRVILWALSNPKTRPGPPEQPEPPEGIIE